MPAAIAIPAGLKAIAPTVALFKTATKARAPEPTKTKLLISFAVAESAPKNVFVN